MKMSAAKLAVALRAMADAVEVGDSFEGSVSYTMRKAILALVLSAVVLISVQAEGWAAEEFLLYPARGVIRTTAVIFARIERRSEDGAQIEGSIVNEPCTSDGIGGTLLWSRFKAVVEPPSGADATRIALCVTEIAPDRKTMAFHGVKGKVHVDFDDPEHRGCIGAMQDFSGAVGLPVDGIAPGAAVRIVLLGDLTFVDDTGNSSYVVDLPSTFGRASNGQ